jgi:hypothetical protein
MNYTLKWGEQADNEGTSLLLGLVTEVLAVCKCLSLRHMRRVCPLRSDPSATADGNDCGRGT